MADQKTLSTAEKSIQNDIVGLTSIHRFGWIRQRELGHILWPASKSSHVMGAQLCRRWVNRGMVLERRLELNHGNAFILSKLGADWLLANAGVNATSDTKSGYFTEQKEPKPGAKPKAKIWSPCVTFRHDLLAASFLTQRIGAGRRVITELEIQRATPNRPGKRPDGLLRTEDGKWLWVEVENAKKSGEDLRLLANAMIAACRGENFDASIKLDGAILVCDRDGPHKRTTTAAIKKALPLKSSIDMCFCLADIVKGAIQSFEFVIEKIENDFAGTEYQYSVMKLGWRPINADLEEFMERPPAMPFSVCIKPWNGKICVEIKNIDTNSTLKFKPAESQDRTKAREFAQRLLLREDAYTTWFKENGGVISIDDL